MKTNQVKHFVLSMIIVMLMGMIFPGASNMLYAESPKEDNMNSSVRISWDELKELLKIDSDEVILTWDEFKKLIAQTGSEVKVEYNLQNGKVVLTREQFKKLLDNMKIHIISPTKPPRDYIITKSEYTCRVKEKSTQIKTKLYMEIFENDKNTYSKIRLMPQSVALKEVKINNQKAIIMIESGWYVLATSKTGQQIVDIEFSVKSALDKGPNVLTFTMPETAITIFNITIPMRNINIEINNAKQMDITKSGNSTIINAVLSTTSHFQLKAHPTVKIEKKKVPAKIYAETMNLLSIEEDALRITTKIRLNILQNTISDIQVQIPSNYSILYVRDQNYKEIRDWKTKTENNETILEIPFGAQKEGIVMLTIVSEEIFEEKENKISFTGFKVIGAIRETGYVGAEKKSTAEAEITGTENIDRIDIQELPYDLINMSKKPLIFGLRYLRHPYSLSMKITKHEEMPVVNTVIDNASIMSVILEEGKIITRIVYTVRNMGKQFLKLKLPENAEIWSLYVNGKREIPAKNDEGIFMLPLARSKIDNENIIPFNIEILYYYKTNRFSFMGSKKIQFPTVNAIISKMLWSCYLPADYRFIRFSGNLDKEKLASGFQPFLGRTRMFTYSEVGGYNRALEDWEGSSEQNVDQKLRGTQELLKSEFSRGVLNEKDAFLGQLKQEINFNANIQEEQKKSIAGGGDISLIKIEMPTTGQLYRFAKTLIEGEDVYLEFQYTQGWVSTAIKVILILLLLYIIFLLRFRIKDLYNIVKRWILKYNDFWNKLKTQKGMMTLCVIGAFLFWFLNKFIFVIFILLFLLIWIKPEWVTILKKKAKGEGNEE